MRVAMHWVQTESGGVDSYLITFLKKWPDQSDQFLLLCNSDNMGAKRIAPELKRFGIDFAELPAAGTRQSGIKSLFRFLFFPIYFFLLKLEAKRELKKYGLFDALIVQNGCYPGSWQSLASLWAAYELNMPKRMLVIHHGALHNNIFRNVGEFLVDHMIHKWATDIVAVSRATRKTLIDYRGFDPYRNPIRVIHNGVDKLAANEHEYPSLREQFKINADQILLGIVGRIERYKGHEDLLLALDNMREDEKRRFTVIFIGCGKNDEIERLKQISEQLDLNDNVIFSGYLPEDPVHFIAQLDIMLMLTKDFEGFGLTIAEAMFAKTPVIATAVGAVPEFVNDNIVSLVPPESPANICDVLLEYILDRRKFTDMAVKAEQHIQKYSGKRMRREYHRLLHLH
jgi:glycosyltransferase involved in cell wall biosynthesis